MITLLLLTGAIIVGGMAGAFAVVMWLAYSITKRL